MTRCPFAATPPPIHAIPSILALGISDALSGPFELHCLPLSAGYAPVAHLGVVTVAPSGIAGAALGLTRGVPRYSGDVVFLLPAI